VSDSERPEDVGLPDHLRVTWDDNAGGDPVPLVVRRPTRLRVVVTDATGTVLPIRGELSATIVHAGRGKELKAATRRPKYHTFVIRPRSIPRGRGRCTLKLSFTPDQGEPLPGRAIELLPLWRHRLARLARYAAAVAIAYAFAIFPQIDDLISRARETAIVPIIAFLLLGSLTATREVVWRKLHYPNYAFAVAAVALVAVTVLRYSLIVVVNHSLETVPIAEGNEIAPGEYAVTWRNVFDPRQAPHGANESGASTPAWVPCEEEASPPVKSTSDAIPVSGGTAASLLVTAHAKTCELFPTPDGFRLQLTKLLLLRRVRLGCRDVGLPARYRDRWASAGSCDLPEGIRLEKEPLEVALRPEVSARYGTDRVTVHYDWRDDRLVVPGTDEFHRLRFHAPEAAASVGIGFTLLGGHQIRQVEARLVAAEGASGRDDQTNTAPFLPILTPLALTQSNPTLEGHISVGEMQVGRFVAVLEQTQSPGAPSPGEHDCWLVPTGERLGSFVLRASSSRASSVFHSIAPEFVSNIPICWTLAGRPDFGELHLDPRWSPSAQWVLTLPWRLVPRRLSILRGDGQFWGRLECRANEGGNWQIGPVLLRDPRKELGLLQNKHQTWESSQPAAAGDFFWGCWRAPADPTSDAKVVPELSDLRGKERWHLVASKHREYHASQALQRCVVYPDGTPAQHDCEQISGASRDKWVAEHASPECDPEKVVLCKPGSAHN
jgi:hypothetical protein